MLTTLEKLREHYSNPLIVPTAPVMLRFVNTDIEIPLDILHTRFGSTGELVTTLNTTLEDLEARIAEEKARRKPKDQYVESKGGYFYNID